MKRVIMCALFCCGGMLAGRAEGPEFSRSLTPQDFAAAGLTKLAPEELARLDALVRAFRAQAPQRRAPAAASVPNVGANPQPAPAAKRKAILAPGTEVEYQSTESRIVGEFRGWESRTVFTLENGERWQVAAGQSYVGPLIMNPAVKITPGMLGSFWMSVEGVRVRAKVTPVRGRTQ